mmetsp:Transcript_18846/g.37268  ORF Transcript_18846/g.37268 Transcript_18846/m.37268 type:complete len:244 (-) Transcript_18846:562-1293(-)
MQCRTVSLLCVTAPHTRIEPRPCAFEDCFLLERCILVLLWPCGMGGGERTRDQLPSVSSPPPVAAVASTTAAPALPSDVCFPCSWSHAFFCLWTRQSPNGLTSVMMGLLHPPPAPSTSNLEGLRASPTAESSLSLFRRYISASIRRPATSFVCCGSAREVEEEAVADLGGVNDRLFRGVRRGLRVAGVAGVEDASEGRTGTVILSVGWEKNPPGACCGPAAEPFLLVRSLPEARSTTGVVLRR